MAHPKRKISRTRRDKRRTHYKATTPQIATCPTTGEAHLYHRAHWHVRTETGRETITEYLTGCGRHPTTPNPNSQAMYKIFVLPPLLAGVAASGSRLSRRSSVSRLEGQNPAVSEFV